MFASTFAVLRTLGVRRAPRPPREMRPARASTRPQPFACYICDSPMALVEDVEMAAVNVADMRRHAMRCPTCGMMADRIYHPALGYDRGLVL